jgi:isopenicillin-N N-acyltransferase-like protein
MSPIDVKAVGAAESRLAHGNVFADLSPERGLEDRLAGLYPQFCDRAERAGGLMAEGPIDVERLKAVLSDHGNRPESICRHPEDQPEEAPAAIILGTVVSVVMDLTEGALYITGGPPCRNPYAEHRLTRSEYAGA